MPARIIALVLGLALLVPASAFAQGGTFGSPLTAPNNMSVGCETHIFPNGNADPVGFASTDPDCTWRQPFVQGLPPNDARGSYVPGTGTIVQMEVKSGNAPVAPLRVTKLSQINDAGVAGDGLCCFFESETQAFPMTPNAITAVPLNIPVTRGIVGKFQITDAVAVSAANGAGALPLSQVGNQNMTSGYTFGSPAVSWFYPRLGPQDGTNTGGRPESEGMPGTELLVRWTWVPAGSPAGSPVPTKPVATNPPLTSNGLRLALNGGFANIRSGNALIEVLCQGNAICEGELAVISLGGLAQRKKGAVTLYSKKRKYKVAPGKKATVKVPLSAKGKRLLKKKSKLKAALRITPKGGTATTTKLTLRKKQK